MVVASTIACSPTVQVLDLLYLSAVDMITRLLGNWNLFGVNVTVEMGSCPQQDGTTDCGAFTIATCTAQAYGNQAGSYDQKQMKGHPLKCFETYVVHTILLC